MARYLLVPDELLKALAEEECRIVAPVEAEHYIVTMAMELVEYRRAYGPLGCAFLENSAKEPS